MLFRSGDASRIAIREASPPAIALNICGVLTKKINFTTQLNNGNNRASKNGSSNFHSSMHRKRGE